MEKKKKRRNCVPISFSCPMDLLDTIDDLADKNDFSRSEQIVEILKEKLQQTKK